MPAVWETYRLLGAGGVARQGDESRSGTQWEGSSSAMGAASFGLISVYLRFGLRQGLVQELERALPGRGGRFRFVNLGARFIHEAMMRFITIELIF
jgi:hypothetical protein